MARRNRIASAALGDAGVAADQITYVEAHGTGTPLGDPIEVCALQAVIGRRSPTARLLHGLGQSQHRAFGDGLRHRQLDPRGADVAA